MTDPEIQEAERRGYAAFINGRGLKDCPMENNEEKAAWVRGFNLSANTVHGVLL
jgi:ribosome modulation factor